MSDQILSTKLFVPPLRPKIVPRPRLIERLNENPHHRLTLISAPAGFGKTTLASEWVTDGGRPFAWLSLEAGDSDPTRFMAYLVAALQTVAPHVGQGVSGMLQSPQSIPAASILALLINDIANVSERFVLVLDDYHELDAEPIDKALTFLLDRLPPQMHLVIATREDPQLPLARLRARDQLSEVRAADLRFTPGEAAGFLNRMMGLNLSAQDIAALDTRTEGWIAGLQLAALSMQGHKDVTGFIKTFAGSHQFVMDYLVEEVLQQQPPNIQSFLLHTSILDRLCGPLCDAVLDDPSIAAQETLEYIDRANLFVIPLDDRRQWFRYHHLFADLLRRRLQHNSAVNAESKRHVAGLHLKASAWYEENGLQSEAFHHAVTGGDLERAAALAERAWPAMDRQFQTIAWLGWVRALPEAMVRARPVLCLGYAWALINVGELEAGADRLRDAEQWLDPPDEKGGDTDAFMGEMIVVDEDQYRMLPSGIASARAYIAHVFGDVNATVMYARRALDFLPEDDHLNRGSTISLLGCSYWATGDLEAAYQTLAEGMQGMQRGGNILWAISVTIGLAKIRIVQGRLGEAVKSYEQSIQIAARHGVDGLPVSSYMHSELSLVRCEQGDLDAAARHLKISEEQGRQAAFPEWQYRWHLAKARLNEAHGDLDAALAMLDEAQRFYCRTPLPDLRPVAALKAQVRVSQGRMADALDWVRSCGLSADDELSYLREFQHVTLARVLIAEYQQKQSERLLQKALELLARLLTAAEEGRRTGSVIEILVLQALALEAQGNIPLALEPLERALALAEPEGYVQIFVDGGAALSRLLHEIAAQGKMPDYAATLLAAFDIGGSRKTGEPASPSDQPLLEPLSRRELEVLQLISQGRSNREISERLFLALTTVKGHNRNIFGKLQVKRRTEAVARARELGLL